MGTFLDEIREKDPELYEIEMRGAGRVDPPEDWQAKFHAKLEAQGTRLGVSPVSANCISKYHAVHQSGRRPLSWIRYVVLHDEEAITAVSAASWFQNRASGGSAHLCIDAGACYRTLANNIVPWGAPGVNTTGFHIEMAGYARWSRAEWLAHHGTIYRAAFKAFYHAHLFGIPYRLLTDKQLAGGKAKGFITHRQVTRVLGGGTHTDPGAYFPLDVFMKNVKRFANV